MELPVIKLKFQKSIRSNRWLARRRKKNSTKSKILGLVFRVADFVIASLTQNTARISFGNKAKLPFAMRRLFSVGSCGKKAHCLIRYVRHVRRLKNAIEFKKVITDTQWALAENVRAKRLVELSPSVAKPPAKVRAAGTLRRRSIDFTLADEASTQIPVSAYLHMILI